MQRTNNALDLFHNNVGVRFQLYNGLFTALPIKQVSSTGTLLSLFFIHLQNGYKEGHSPQHIVESFFDSYTPIKTDKERFDQIFRFIQFSERQVVLFDALEDGAFTSLHDMYGSGSIFNLRQIVAQNDTKKAVQEKLKTFSIRLTLTAHPTQFYPGEVLGIINDMSKALKCQEPSKVNMYLCQLAKTPFFHKVKPTPFDEAKSLIWYLEHIFYPASGNILLQLKEAFFPSEECDSTDQAVVDVTAAATAATEQKKAIYNLIPNNVIRMGFWPGGDRDGNPYVRVETTLRVAQELKDAIVRSYWRDIKELRRRLTFRGVEDIILEVDKKLYAYLYGAADKSIILSQEYLLERFMTAREILITTHDGLFVELVENFICKIHIFGLYFATLDIRQDSTLHKQLLNNVAQRGKDYNLSFLPYNYNDLTEDEKIAAITNLIEDDDTTKYPINHLELLHDNEIEQDTLLCVKAIENIQKLNGQEGCHRYIISHSTSALDVFELLAIFKLGGWKDMKQLSVDILPLFESVEDLQNASETMSKLYKNNFYREHLSQRDNKQSIMMGFSDGTKDGSYLMANWSIYKAKKELTNISRLSNISVVFFDGRGGPPSRGGGKTQQFYASMGNHIENREIQTTIQGQSISSKYGTIDSAQYNIEQLITAGLSSSAVPKNYTSGLHTSLTEAAANYSGNNIDGKKRDTLTPEDEAVFNELSTYSYEYYTKLCTDPEFFNYLDQITPLRFIGKANIGSRPSKRQQNVQLSLDVLRAIPYVGSWNMVMQNITGYFGLGYALSKFKQSNRFHEVQGLYHHSLFFRTLLDNSEMSMFKVYFPLTAYLQHDKQFANIWKIIYDEFELTKKLLLDLSGHEKLMENYPIEAASISMRKDIILPLTTIQQYALSLLRQQKDNNNGDNNNSSTDSVEKTQEQLNHEAILGRMAMRCTFGIINAGRNAA